MTRRAERVSTLIRQEICELLLEHVNDPRLNGLISVTEVSTSPDLKNARIYVSSNNLLTFTKYTGYDPEIGGDSYSIDRAIYPQARSLLFGVNIEF